MGQWRSRRAVAKLVDTELRALDTTVESHPVHPLYLPADADPEPRDERVPGIGGARR